jgi:antitoxin ParD1/3/4
MSKIDIPVAPVYFQPMSMNVSLGLLEDFVREKVAQGEYETASEVVRDGLRLLKRREELWKARIQAQIEGGMASCRAGRTIPAEKAWSQLRTWRDKQKKTLKS